MGCGRDNAGGCSVSPLETSHHPTALHRAEEKVNDRHRHHRTSIPHLGTTGLEDTAEIFFPLGHHEQG